MKLLSRKAIAIIVMLLVLTLVLAACRDREDVDPDLTANGGEQTEGTTSAPPSGGDNNALPPPDGVHHPVDMGGRTLLAASSWGNPMPFYNLNDDEPDPAVTENYLIERLIWDNGLRAKQQFNFDVDYVHVVEDFIGVFTASVMAGSPIADLFFLEGGDLLSSIIGDLIMPWSVVDLPGSDIFGPGIYGRVSTHLFGEDWGVYYNSPNPHVWMMGVNLDLIHAVGAPNPVDLYNNGQWTWDAALNIMRMATRDTTGDGLFDQWGIAGQPVDIVRHFMAANDAPFVDDNFNYAFDHPASIETLEFMEIIFREGLWQYDPVLGFNPGDWGRNFFAAHEGNAALFPSILWGMNGGDLPFEFAVVPFPVGPSNTADYTWLGGFGGGLSLPFGSTWTPEDKLIIIEEFLAWPGDEVELISEGGLNWPRSVLLTEEDVQRWWVNGARPRLDVGTLVPEYYWVLGDFVGAMYDQSMTVLQMVEYHRQPRQEMLDHFFAR